MIVSVASLPSVSSQVTTCKVFFFAQMGYNKSEAVYSDTDPGVFGISHHTYEILHY